MMPDVPRAAERVVARFGDGDSTQLCVLGNGAIRIEHKGLCIVKPMSEWHALAALRSTPATPPKGIRASDLGAGGSAGTPTPEAIAELCARLNDGATDYHAAHSAPDVPDECGMRDVGYNFGRFLGPAAAIIEQMQAEIARLTLDLAKAQDCEAHFHSLLIDAEAEAAALRELLREVMAQGVEHETPRYALVQMAYELRVAIDAALAGKEKGD